ncbi:hypothetical protein C8P68_10497 [Mucilaginibacter yixingensis]|uniref:Uncharacterized protein n=1 Tax=Mucilaginibacter yixingensis TaxID=1295612 RepID=A0A2T5J958_9SPHI|nr:hypothetical protein [Mucilaginibacter yixingensis]PTQ96612.1 hypothetical protein C8P68_10497 [Mucilaginibacter yixingensis]
MKKYLTALVLLLCVVIYACHKEKANESSPDSKSGDGITFNLRDAKNFLKQTTDLKANAITQPGDSGNVGSKGTILWKKARIYKRSNNLEVVEVPIAFNKKQVPLFNERRDSVKTPPDITSVEAAFTRLLIYQDVNSKVINKELVTYIPDKETVTKLNGDISNNWIDKLQSQFSGYLYYQAWNHQPLHLVRVKNGIKTANYRLSSNGGSGGPQLSVQSTLKTNEIECDLYSTPTYTFDCVVNTETGEFRCTQTSSGSIDYLYCYDNSNPLDPNPNPPPTDPGNGGGYVPSITDNDVNLSFWQTNSLPEINPSKFASCFNDNKQASSYTMTLYVKQPIPGDKSSWVSIAPYSSYMQAALGQGIIWMTPNSGWFNSGHTFVGFTKNNTDGTNVTQVIGFWPSPQSPTVVSRGSSQDDSNFPYTVSYTITVTQSQFNAGLNAVIYDGYNPSLPNLSNVNFVLLNVPSSGYTEYNDTDAALHWFAAAGTTISSPSHDNFTHTAGELGETIRAMSGAVTTAGYAPQGKGACN